MARGSAPRCNPMPEAARSGRADDLADVIEGRFRASGRPWASMDHAGGVLPWPAGGLEHSSAVVARGGRPGGHGTASITDGGRPWRAVSSPRQWAPSFLRVTVAGAVNLGIVVDECPDLCTHERVSPFATESLLNGVRYGLLGGFCGLPLTRSSELDSYRLTHRASHPVLLYPISYHQNGKIHLFIIRPYRDLQPFGPCRTSGTSRTIGNASAGGTPSDVPGYLWRSDRCHLARMSLSRC